MYMHLTVASEKKQQKTKTVFVTYEIVVTPVNSSRLAVTNRQKEG